ncbi:MAG: ATP-dependent DNA helicase [Promethearchaeota archaeon]
MGCMEGVVLYKHKEEGYAASPVRCGTWSCPRCSSIKKAQIINALEYYIEKFKMFYFNTLTVNKDNNEPFFILNSKFKQIQKYLKRLYSLPREVFINKIKNEFLPYDLDLHSYRIARYKAILEVATDHKITYKKLSPEKSREFREKHKDEIEKKLRNYSIEDYPNKYYSIKKRLISDYLQSYDNYNKDGLTFVRFLEHPETNAHFHILLNVLIPEKFLQGKKGINEIYDYPKALHKNFNQDDPKFYNKISLYVAKYLTKSLTYYSNIKRKFNLISHSRNINFKALKGSDFEDWEFIDVLNEYNINSFTRLFTSRKKSIEYLESVQHTYKNNLVSLYSEYQEFLELQHSKLSKFRKELETEPKPVRKYLLSQFYPNYYKEYWKGIERLLDKVLKQFSKSTKKINLSPGAYYKLIESKDLVKLDSLIKNHKLIFISGQAGSGKTTLIREFLMYRSLNENDVLLVAPSGKASSRLYEVVGGKYRYQTIDKACNSDFEGVFNRNPSNCLPYRFVFLDECSMLDAEKFLKLLFSLREDCRLVMIGDPNQLQPIHSFSIIPFLDKYSVRINRKTQFRNNNNVYSQAQKVLNDFNDFIGDIPVISLSDMLNILNNQDIDNVQFLTDTRRLSRVINNHITGGEYEKGQKVISVVNNAVKQTLNGMMGKITFFSECECWVNYGNGLEVKYDPFQYQQFEHSYSITIHKSQGSEYNSGIVFLSNPKMITRELLYTAVTRFKSHVQFYIIRDDDIKKGRCDCV